MTNQELNQSYNIARNEYANYGVDVDQAIKDLNKISLSINCWQGDDVNGFEVHSNGLNGGGIQTTGNYPGKARNADELRSDLEQVFKLVPGKHRLNLHSTYLESEGKKVERNKIEPKYYSRWVDWSKDNCSGLDFNPTFFSHPLAQNGFTLSSPDNAVRNFWVEHGIASREIASYFGKELGVPSVNNIWIPDGYKDTPIDRKTPRERLVNSLNKIFKKDFNKEVLLDSVESKLFGIGSESYVVGSYEFYLGYAIKNNKLLCIDTGHFHPTEVIADKISSVLLYLDRILLHISRGVRWDSDHVVTFSEELNLIAQEVIRGDYIDRIHIGLDFFDASINRVAAWVIGSRNVLKALLNAMLEPIELLRSYENNGDYTSRLALLEELKTNYSNAIWDFYCYSYNVPIGINWLDEIKIYERNVLSYRK